MPDVLALGDINIDINARLPEYPQRGENAVALTTTHHVGGSAANTALGLALMGVKVSLIARLGLDPWGSMALHRLREAGVDVSNVQQDATANTGLIYIAVTPDGERTMMSDRGANALTDPSEIDAAAFQQARLFHLSGYSLLVEPQRSAALFAVEAARESGLRITLDPGMSASRTALETMRSLLPKISVVTPSLAEARELTGLVPAEACAQALLDMGARVVALKLGGDGCLVATGKDLVAVPAFRLEACDSTGAGDSFAAGLIAGHLAGLSWHSAAVLGNALGGLTAAQEGARLPGRPQAQVRSLLREALSQPAFRDHAATIDAVGANLDSLMGTNEEGIPQ
jgi:ribokinase